MLGTDGTVGNAGVGTVGIVGAVGIGTVGAVGTTGAVGSGGTVGAVGMGELVDEVTSPAVVEETTAAMVDVVVVVSFGFPLLRVAKIATVPRTKITSVRPDQNCAPPRLGLRCVRLCLRFGGVARPERADLWGDFAMTDGEITR